MHMFFTIVTELVSYTICIVAIQASEMGTVPTKNCCTDFLHIAETFGVVNLYLYPPLTATTLSKNRVSVLEFL